MSRWKKVVTVLLVVFNLAVAGVITYAVRVTSDANQMMNNVQQKLNRKSSLRSGGAPDINNAEPFSILLLGVDTGDLGRTDQGRSDTMMVVTVNPQQKKSTIVSLDRDILTKIVGYGENDKLNHAYAYGGVKMSMNTVENLLDIPIDHYVTMNMKGLTDLVDAVGGVEVNNARTFDLDGITVKKGKQTLKGKKALAYARMRYEDPEGDVGRQKRQREVVTKILKKVMSINGVSNHQKILKAVEKNMKTDLSWDDMVDIGSNYLPAFDKINQKQLAGKNDMTTGVYYQILGTEELLETQNTLKKQLELPTKKTLPNLKDEDAENLFYDDSNGRATDDKTQYAPGYDHTDNYDAEGNFLGSSNDGTTDKATDDTTTSGATDNNSTGYGDNSAYEQPATDSNNSYGSYNYGNDGYGANQGNQEQQAPAENGAGTTNGYYNEQQQAPAY